MREIDRVWSIRHDSRTGEYKPRTEQLKSWGYLLTCLRGVLPAKIPPRRETEEAQWSAQRDSNPEWSRNLMDEVMAKAGGAPSA